MTSRGPDTLAAVKRMVAAGLTELQAEAIVYAVLEDLLGVRRKGSVLNLPPWWRYGPTVAPIIATVAILAVGGFGLVLLWSGTS